MLWPQVPFICSVLVLLGACVGSFLNVVVHRLPAGMSLLWPSSRCPRCGHAIRCYDNIPIIGWLILAGRCRDCGASISLRYPAVELATSALFLYAGLVDILGGGRDPSFMVSVSKTACHAVLFSTLLCAALLRSVGLQPPVAVYLPAAAVQIVSKLVLTNDLASDAMVAVAGVSSGILFGIAAVHVGTPEAPPDRQRASRATAFGVVGLVLGPSGVSVASVISIVSAILFSAWRNRRIRNQTGTEASSVAGRPAEPQGTYVAGPEIFLLLSTIVSVGSAPVIERVWPCEHDRLVVFAVALILVWTLSRFSALRPFRRS